MKKILNETQKMIDLNRKLNNILSEADDPKEKDDLLFDDEESDHDEPDGDEIAGEEPVDHDESEEEVDEGLGQKISDKYHTQRANSHSKSGTKHMSKAGQAIMNRDRAKEKKHSMKSDSHFEKAEYHSQKMSPEARKNYFRRKYNTEGKDKLQALKSMIKEMIAEIMSEQSLDEKAPKRRAGGSAHFPSRENTIRSDDHEDVLKRRASWKPTGPDLKDSIKRAKGKLGPHSEPDVGVQHKAGFKRYEPKSSYKKSGIGRKK